MDIISMILLTLPVILYMVIQATVQISKLWKEIRRIDKELVEVYYDRES